MVSITTTPGRRPTQCSGCGGHTECNQARNGTLILPHDERKDEDAFEAPRGSVLNGHAAPHVVAARRK